MGQLITIGVLLLVGYFWGSYNEKKHYKSIRIREKQTKSLPAVNFKGVPFQNHLVKQQKLVMGSTVVSIDYFKRFLAGLKMLIGGRLNSYESLIDRARREALLRMKKDAEGYNMIVNVKMETSSISKGQKDSIGSVEILVYGTAIKIDEVYL